MKNTIVGIYRSIRFEYKIGIVYAIIGFLWILLSDTFIDSVVSNKTILTTLQTFKGSFYVLITTILLIYLVKRHMKKLLEANSLIKQRTDKIETQNKEYKQLNEELQVAKEKAEESDRLKSSFLQNMSHEVRTPLNAIVGFSQFMARPDLPHEKYEKFSKLILESSNKLIEIITDVIEISQIYAKLYKIKTHEFDLINLVKEIIDKYKSRTIEKNIELELKFNISEEKYLIITDEEKLKRIVTHLLDNAVKFTLNGKIQLLCEVNTTNILFNFSDTGIGISEELQNSIFEPFRQVETGICRTFGGNGLGLPIVKAYTEILEGNVSLKSELGKGTNISVLIPLKKTELDKSKEIVKKHTNSVHTILIAEDEYSNFEYLLAILENLNLNILYAENGQRAVDICRSNPEIGLILMDIKMPVLDGISATKKIREFRPDLIIIAQTAYALESEKDRCINIFDDYITKPIKIDELKEKLMSRIKK